MTTSVARPRALLTTFLAGILVAACSGSGSPSAAPSSTAGPSVGGESASPDATASVEPSAVASVVPSEDDLGPFGCDSPVEGTGNVARGQITDVAVGAHAGYDRIVFDFAEGVPPWHLEIAEPPYLQDGSGLPIEVEGAQVWQLRLNGGTRVSPDGDLTYSGPTEFAPGFDKLVHLVEAGDFEAVSTWYIGLAGESCVRILLLSAPARLVIDVEH